jgi:hypothetical protein
VCHPIIRFCDRDWLFFYFFPEEKKKIVGRMERNFTVLVALAFGGVGGAG